CLARSTTLAVTLGCVGTTERSRQPLPATEAETRASAPKARLRTMEPMGWRIILMLLVSGGPLGPRYRGRVGRRRREHYVWPPRPVNAPSTREDLGFSHGATASVATRVPPRKSRVFP